MIAASHRDSIQSSMMILRHLLPFAALLAAIPAQDDPKPQGKPSDKPKAEAKPAQEPKDGKEAAADKVDFVAQVLPILEKNCVECHKAPYTDADGKKKRPKGGVSLDTRDGIEKGKKGKLVVGKKPGDSMLYHSITLPADDEDRMPPAKKGDPLPQDQIDLIKKWIEEGADFGTWKGAEAKADAKTEGKQEKKADDDQKKSEDKKKGDSKDKDAGKGGLSMLDAGLPMLGEEEIAAVRAHFSVEPAAADTSLLRVTAFGRESSVDDAAIAALSNASGHIAELVLARTQTTDAAMAAIASMPRLVHLDLRGTKVTDDGVIALAGATQLRSLNLYGTSVGDRGIAALSACKNLEQLYVCETPVSAAAVVTLNASLPSARIVFAADLPQPMADADQGNARARRR